MGETVHENHALSQAVALYFKSALTLPGLPVLSLPLLEAGALAAVVYMVYSALLLLAI